MNFGNCVQDIEQFHHSKKLFPLQLIPGSTLMSQTIYAFLSFLEFHMMESSGMSILLCVFLFYSFLLLNSIPLQGYITIFFIHSHIGEYLDYFQFLTIMDNTTGSFGLSLHVNTHFHFF